jgi:hypothetical protein
VRVPRPWARYLGAVALIAASLYAGRTFLLRSAGSFLVIDDQVQKADHILVIDADRTIDQAAALYRAGVAPRLLVIQRRLERLEKLGLRPAYHDRTASGLCARGVPKEALTVIPGKALTDWDEARALDGWMVHDPAASVAVLCDRFHSREVRYIMDKVLGPVKARRLQMLPAPSRTYDETTWWRHRLGILDFFRAYVRLGFVRVNGEGREAWREWDPKSYEMTLPRRR